MSQKNRKGAIQEAVDRLLAEEEDMTENDGLYRYAKVVRQAFDEIRMLLGRGVKFIRICKSFEVAGLLPKNASTHSFRQAFHRECKRRGEEYTRVRQINEKKISPDSSPSKLKTKKTGVDSEDEKLKKILGGKQASAPNGTVVRTVDGGFDF